MPYTSGFRRERSRRRRQFLRRTASWLLGLAVLVGLGYSAYQTGTILAESRVTDLAGRVNELTAQLDGTRRENSDLQASLADAKKAVVEQQGRYDRDVPKGDAADLLRIAMERLGRGVRVDRLAQALRDARETRACDARTVRKRFAIQQGPKQPDDTAALLDGMIQVTVGMPGGSSDLSKAAVTVAMPWANEPLKMTGLPARQDIVINNLLLHLAVEASDLPGYAAATLSVCGKA